MRANPGTNVVIDYYICTNDLQGSRIICPKIGETIQERSRGWPSSKR